jgi:hypothetical protein
MEGKEEKKQQILLKKDISLKIMRDLKLLSFKRTFILYMSDQNHNRINQKLINFFFSYN